MRSADGYLIDKCLNGEPEAFGVLVDRYRASMFALAYSKLRNFEDAEDVTQDAFVLAYKNLRTLKQYDSFHAWLYSITSNLCKKLKIKQSRLPDSEFIEDQSPGMMRRASMNSYREEVSLKSIHEALDSLPQMYREVLTLHYLGGMNSDEIAETLGASPSAIRQRLSRARMQLKEEIIAMMSEAFSQRRLSAKFTFNIVEMIKKIKIHPPSTIKGMPWGLSLATGIIIAIMSLNPYVNWFSQIGTYVSSVLPSETKVLKVGEIPVDVVKTSSIAILSSKMGKGKSGEPKQPDMQKAFFMAPQGEGKWENKADMPTGRALCSSCVLNGKVYVIGGINNSRYIATAEEYDPKLDKWTTKADMPTPRCNTATVEVSGKIYVIGGWNESRGLSVIEEYDPINNIWEKKTPMPSAKTNASATYINGKIYVLGGNSIEGVTDSLSFFIYDPAIDQWEKLDDVPDIYSATGSSIFVADSKIYLLGGSNHKLMEYQKNVIIYDIQTKKWNKGSELPIKRIGMAGGMIDRNIFLIGGHALNGDLPQIEVYNIDTDSWEKESRPDMPTSRSNFASSQIDNKIYIMGGTTSWQPENIWPDDYLSTNEVYDLDNRKSVDPNGKLPTTWGNIKSR
jgi:RNA polymerase sigma factor (sigma-70 family)